MTTTQERKDDPMTFEQIRELFQEIGRKQEENARKHDEAFQKHEEDFRKLTQGFEEVRRMQEDLAREQEKTDQQMKETDKQIKENGKQMGYLSNRYGEIAEHQLLPNLEATFNTLNLNLGGAFRPPHSRFEDPALNIYTEVDACLENDDIVVIVEMKTNLKIEHIDYHVKRMEKIRAIANVHNDKRKYYGAIAGLMMSVSEKTYALKQGFYVLEPVGEHFTITAPTAPFEPKAW
jgi:hypothetical protein